jgi:hypothetical protein
MARAQQIRVREDEPIFLDPKLREPALSVARAEMAHTLSGERLASAHAIGAAFMAA